MRAGCTFRDFGGNHVVRALGGGEISFVESIFFNITIFSHKAGVAVIAEYYGCGGTAVRI